MIGLQERIRIITCPKEFLFLLHATSARCVEVETLPIVVLPRGGTVGTPFTTLFLKKDMRDQRVACPGCVNQAQGGCVFTYDQGVLASAQSVASEAE